jgi:RNA polymerase sigma factor (sigma-70 family)
MRNKRNYKKWTNELAVERRCDFCGKKARRYKETDYGIEYSVVKCDKCTNSELYGNEQDKNGLKSFELLGDISNYMRASVDPWPDLESKMVLALREESLSERQRHVLEMHMDGYNYREIAEELGSSIGNISSVLNGIREKLSEPT